MIVSSSNRDDGEGTLSASPESGETFEAPRLSTEEVAETKTFSPENPWLSPRPSTAEGAATKTSPGCWLTTEKRFNSSL